MEKKGKEEYIKVLMKLLKQYWWANAWCAKPPSTLRARMSPPTGGKTSQPYSQHIVTSSERKKKLLH